MNTSAESISTQHRILDNFAYHLAGYRVLYRLWEQDHCGDQFWVSTANAYVRLTVIDWCMIFGSDDKNTNKTHWKNVHRSEEERDEVRRLLVGCFRSQAAWCGYARKMRDYRNKVAAHTDPGEERLPACFDEAYCVACAYADWLDRTYPAAPRKGPLRHLYKQYHANLERNLARLARCFGNGIPAATAAVVGTAPADEE